jgi:pantetheine-phosphate adenylyltransferase
MNMKKNSTRDKIRKAIYPGTFDPITYGHIDVLERACLLFDHVIIAVATSSSKKTAFTVDERIEMIKECTKEFKNISVSSFKGLLVNYAVSQKADAVVRGLRAISDFEYEFQMALTNRKIAENVTTVFLMPNEKYTYLNSTLVREIAANGGDVSSFVPKPVLKKLLQKFGK